MHGSGADTEREKERERESAREALEEDTANERIEKQQLERRTTRGVESLVNLKRNLRSVILAYRFTPVGVAKPATVNFCTLARERKANSTRYRRLSCRRLMDQRYRMDLETSTSCKK